MVEADSVFIRQWYQTTGRHHVNFMRWYRTCGYAQHSGVGVYMDQPSSVSGDDIEFVPGLRTVVDGRDMTPEEIQTLQKILIQMANDARDALDGNSTLVVVMK